MRLNADDAGRNAPSDESSFDGLAATAGETHVDVRASDPVFAQPSLQLASEMRFYPAQVEGRGAVAMWVTIPITWSR